MLQKLEKEIDDVDAQIGNRWQILDRYVPCCVLNFFLCHASQLVCFAVPHLVNFH